MDISEQFTLSHTSPSLFVGRDALLQSLRAALLEEHVAVLTGARGSGKTALAREYARRFAHAYTHVLWLDATTAEAFMADTLIYEQRFPLPREVVQKGFGGLNEIIEAWASEPDILLVLDNVLFAPDAPLPNKQSSVGGHVLLIRRGGEQRSTVNGLTINPLDAHEGALLVLRQAGLLTQAEPLEQANDEQCQRALELTRELGSLPLVLTLAGGYLRANNGNLRDYLFAYRDCPERPDSSFDAETQTLEVVCDLTLARLMQSQPSALRVLQACTLLSPRAIPLALLQQENLPELLFPGEPEKRSEQMKQALQTLLTYNLLDAQDGANTFHMHPWLQRVICQTLSRERQHELREQLIVACLQLAFSYESASVDEMLPARISLAGHIYSLATDDEDMAFSLQEIAEAYTWAASLLGEQSLTHAGETLLRKALNIWERIVGYSHPSVAGTLFYLAVFNAQLRQYVAAETYAQRALTTTAQILGVNHFKVLACLNILASIYQQQGKLKDAALCYEKALSIGERVDLQQHPLYLTSRKELLKLRLAAGSAT